MQKSITRRNALTGAVAAGSLVAMPLPAHAEAELRAQSAEDRAAYHWAEFARAMNELAANANGWIVNRAGRRDGENWFQLSSIHIHNNIEWHRPIELPAIEWLYNGRAAGGHVS